MQKSLEVIEKTINFVAKFSVYHPLRRWHTKMNYYKHNINKQN